MDNEIDLSDMIPIGEAARIRAVSHSAIQDLIRRGKINAVEIGGRKFLSRKNVENYKSERGGRPAKIKDK